MRIYLPDIVTFQEFTMQESLSLAPIQQATLEFCVIVMMWLCSVHK